MKLAFLLIFGTSPVWVSLVVLTIGGLERHSADYWAVAPWLLIISLPFCIVTFIVATLTVVAYDKATGSTARKLAIATGAFLAQLAAAAAVAGYLYFRRDWKEQELRALDAAAVELANASAQVQRAAGGPFRASVHMTQGGDKPTRFFVHVRAVRPSQVHFDVVVDVVQATGAKLRIACLTRLEIGQHSPGTDVCRQDDSGGNGAYALP